MADDNLVPTNAMVEYYGRRAGTGLIIAEATIITPQGQGYPNTQVFIAKHKSTAGKKLPMKYIKMTVKFSPKSGFDDIELHAANSYLLDQFLHFETNQRSDAWGGNVVNMTRILFAVIDAVKQEIEHVSIRLSPVGYLHIEHDPRDKAVFDYLRPRLNEHNLTYVHTGMYDDSHQDQLNATVTQYIRSHVIANGGYNADSGRKALHNGDTDLIAIGRSLIANPDYVEKVRNNESLTDFNNEHLNALV